MGLLFAIQNILLNNAFWICLCFIAGCILKYKTVKLICQTPNLSDNKVKSITKMISKKLFSKL